MGKSYEFAAFGHVVGFRDFFDEFILDSLFSAQLAQIKKLADLNFQ